MPKENLTIERKPVEKKEDTIESLLQKGKSLNLTDTQIDRLKRELKDEFEFIKQERDEEKFDKFLEAMDNQKKGKMPRNPNRAYNLDSGLTRVKGSDIVRSIVDAILNVEPMVAVSPRPGYAQKAGVEICESQEQFIDYALEEKIPIRKPIRLAADSAVHKRVGITKWVHKVLKEKRIKTETFKGTPEIVGQDPRTGQPIVKNKGLEDFLLAYNDEVKKDPDKHKWIIDALTAGKEISFDAEYDEVVYNDPYPVFVDNKNFYVRKSVEDYDDLCQTQFTGERVNFTYYKLKQLEKENKFINIDKLINDKDGKLKEKYAQEDYDVIECVYYFKLDEDDDEWVKIVCWMAEEDWEYLGGIYFPYTVLQCYYIPHYVVVGEGFYPECPAEMITDQHLAKNAILNHTLESTHKTNTITPIVEEDSTVAQQLNNNLWIDGLPLYAKPGEIDFLNKYMKPVDVNALLILANEVSRVASDIFGVSDLRSGKENPLDPRAPASKIAMLLNESGKDVRDYVLEFAKGFENDIYCMMMIYYEMGDDEQLYYENRYRDVTNQEPKKITKSAMIARTHIQSQAYSFDFNKVNAKKESVLFMNMFGKEPMVNRYYMLRKCMMKWGPEWRDGIDKILPNPKEHNAQMAQIAMQTTVKYMEQKVAESKVTGQAPKLNAKELLGFISQMQTMANADMETQADMAKQMEKKG